MIFSFIDLKRKDINKAIEDHSHNDSEDIVVAVESALSVGTNVEHLTEFELVLSVHHQTACYENQKASVDWPWLHVLVVDAVGNALESKRLNFFRDFLNTSESLPTIGHPTVVIVKVDQLISILHDCCVVLSKELLGDGIKFRHLYIITKIL